MDKGIDEEEEEERVGWGVEKRRVVVGIRRRKKYR